MSPAPKERLLSWLQSTIERYSAYEREQLRLRHLFQRGVKAHGNGLVVEDCPFGGQDGEAWKAGWEAIHAAARYA